MWVECDQGHNKANELCIPGIASSYLHDFWGVEDPSGLSD